VLIQVGLVLFAATFIQGVVGFGMALVAMPLLAVTLGIRAAAPLIALLGLLSPALIAWRYRQQLEWREIAPLAWGSLLGIPIGVALLRLVNEQIVTLALGLVLIGYGLYALRWAVPPWRGTARAAYGLGFAGGVLSGAYNTGGPALVIYGNSRRWPPRAFKANIQVLVVLHSISVVASHALAGNFTGDVWEVLPVGLLATAAGTGCGLLMDRFINEATFRRLVLLLLLVLGGRLVQVSLAGLLT